MGTVLRHPDGVSGSTARRSPAIPRAVGNSSMSSTTQVRSRWRQARSSSSGTSRATSAATNEFRPADCRTARARTRAQIPPTAEAARSNCEQASRIGRCRERPAIRAEIAALNHGERPLPLRAGHRRRRRTKLLRWPTWCGPTRPINSSWPSKLRRLLCAVGEFLSDDPREANTEGGVFPAIFGTVVMTLSCRCAVVPFGVLARSVPARVRQAGPLVSAVRIAINNLAGVPSIVFGVFGLGFFCYIIGGGDRSDCSLPPNWLPTSDVRHRRHAVGRR